MILKKKLWNKNGVCESKWSALIEEKKRGKGTFLAWITKMLWEFWNVFQFMAVIGVKLLWSPFNPFPSKGFRIDE